MSQFQSSFKDKLTTIEQEMRNLPGELDSIVTRLDRGRLTNLFLRLNQDLEKLFDRLFGTRRSEVAASEPSSAQFIRLISDADLAKWREATKSDVQVVIGNGRVEVMAPSEFARKYKATISEVFLAAQQQGYTVLGWKQYQKLLDEIGKLIGGNDRQGKAAP